MRKRKRLYYLKLRNTKMFSIYLIMLDTYISRAVLQANSCISLQEFCFRNSLLSILISDK